MTTLRIKRYVVPKSVKLLLNIQVDKSLINASSSTIFFKIVV